MRYLLIVNPNAGEGPRARDAVMDHFGAGGDTVDEIAADDPEQTRQAIRTACQSDAAPDALIIAGGDGTLFHLAPALLDAARPFGIIPVGTANDLARTLGLPRNLRDAAQVISDGHRRKIDVGQVNDQPFFNVATIGFGAAVAKLHGGPAKRLLGVLNYPLAWWSAYRATRPFRATIRIDEKSIRRRCVQIAVGSGRFYGGGLSLSADASIEDGWLRFYLVKPVGVFGWLRLLPILHKGTLDHATETVTGAAHVVEIKTGRSRPINVDGEVVEKTPARFTISPAGATVFVPQSSPKTESGQDLI